MGFVPFVHCYFQRHSVNEWIPMVLHCVYEIVTYSVSLVSLAVGGRAGRENLSEPVFCSIKNAQELRALKICKTLL